MSKQAETALEARPGPSDLTIAICTIGRDGFLQAAIQSLLETTPPGVSFHLVLNAPLDARLLDSLQGLLSEWNGPVQTTVLEERLTISGSHNTALFATTTDFVTFMGDDDLVLEPRVDELLEQFWQTQPTPAAIGSFCRRVSGSAQAPQFSTNKDYGPVSIKDWEQAKAGTDLVEIVFPSAIYRTELLVEIGGFEERFGSAMDLASFTILAQNHPVLADPRRTFAHRIHDGSVTTSAASQHVQRLRYTEQCMAAIRNGAPQPEWADFVSKEAQGSRMEKFVVGRDITGAALFRAGGAALASGDVISGITKIGKSAVVSPKAFRRRLRSQSNTEQTSEALVTFFVDDRALTHVDMVNELRRELRKHSVELRLVMTKSTSSGAPSQLKAAVPSWFERAPVWELSFFGRSKQVQPVVDFGPKPDLAVVGSQGTAPRSWSRIPRSWRELRPVALWVSEEDLPLKSPEGNVVWLFAEDPKSVGVARQLALTKDEVTQLFDPGLETSRVQLFAEGIVSALRRLS